MSHNFEVLQSKTCEQLRELAKTLGITGRWQMTKNQLIEAILGAENAESGETENEAVQQPVSATDEHKTDDQHTAAAGDKIENKPAGVEINMDQKMRYIEAVELGTIVAFRLSSGKVKSAKVVKKSTRNRKLKLETDYGAVYIVSYEDIVWVRTGKRWPRGVYELLKGKVDHERAEAVN